MKLNEVLTMGGAGSFVRPGTMVNQQVVQPRTIQADNPEQMGKGYEAAKNSQKGQKKIEVDVYNERDVDVVKDPYKDPEELEKRLKKTIFALTNDEIAELGDGWEEFVANKGKSFPNDPRAMFAILKPNASNFDASQVDYSTGRKGGKY
jgi:hypothetical protein